MSKPSERNDLPAPQPPPSKRTLLPPQREGYVPAPEPGPNTIHDDRVKGEAREATGVRPAAIEPAAKPTPAQVADPKSLAAKQAKPAAKSRKGKIGNRLAKLFFVAAIASFVLFFGAIAVGAAAYISIAAELPDPGQLQQKQSTFASTRIYDRDGNLLVELTDPTNPNAGRRTYVRLDQISPYLKQATIATEDPNFYRYSVGFDPIALIRVAYYALTEREFVSGGSTITQQVARNLLFDLAERQSRSAMRKIREIILANELSRRYARDTLLEIYLNEINYGNLAYGIEAAAQTYFDKPAANLNLAESSLLAGLPQLPAYWDPVMHKDRALRRQGDVLRLMAKSGYITDSDIAPAAAAIRNKTFDVRPVNLSKAAPHFMYYVRQWLDSEFGADGLYRVGLRVYTTLDARIQAIAEQAIRDQVNKLADKHVTNGAAVVLDPRTGEILALVGSANFDDEAIDGQVNVALAMRQPGSAIKPFTYLASFEKGNTPATLYWDVPTVFTNTYGQTYAPKNYDDKFHGPMLLREALARSMNVPAVQTMDIVGVPDFLALTGRVGINFPPNDQYGLALTLGGGETRLLDLTAGYAVLANNGMRIPPTPIGRVELADGQLVRDYVQSTVDSPQSSADCRLSTVDCRLSPSQVVAPEHAYLITSILSDNDARAKSFGLNSPLKLSRPAAVKTGTTNDFRDNLTVGYTPDLVVGVWVGNSDNTPMVGVTGITGAAPIWREIMEKALAGQPALEFQRPAGVVDAEICADGGRMPSPTCPPDRRRVEVFKSDQLPLPPDELVERAVQAGDPNLLNAPPVPHSEITISQPANGSSIGRGLLSIRGTINPAGFQSYNVEYGDGDEPGEWKWISGPHLSPVVDGQLTEWGVENLPAGRYTIRVTASTANGPLAGYTHFDLSP